MKISSQNKKIILSAFSLLIVSAATFMFFTDWGDMKHGKNNVLNLPGHESTHNEEINYEEMVNGEEKMWFVTDIQGGFIDYSQNFENALIKEGEDEKIINNEVFYSLVNSEDLPSLIAANSKVLTEKEDLKAVGPFRIQLNDKEILALLNIKPIIGDNKEVTEILYVIKDITKFFDEMKGNADNVDETGRQKYPEQGDIFAEHLRKMAYSTGL